MYLPASFARIDVPVTIVGAGLSGASCAHALHAADVSVRVIDRSRGSGGRMASPTLHGRRVDIGAGYFTVRDPAFATVVDQWRAAGLARPWTDTFSVLSPGAPPALKSGPMRWAAPGGLRSLVRAVLDEVDVEYQQPVDVLPGGPVILAMPDPQAARIVPIPDAVEYLPAIAVVCGFATRSWSFADAAFVHDHPDIEFLADDGARRGDAAPVLVAHTTAALARRHLDDPAGAIAPVVAGLHELLGVGDPAWTHPHRWTFAKPAEPHRAPFGVIESNGGDVALIGDQWCPDGAPRVESAWLSGAELGAAIVSARR